MSLVRAKDPVSGAEVTVSEEYAEAQGLTVLKNKPAHDVFGKTLDPKPRTDKAGEPAATEKE